MTEERQWPAEWMRGVLTLCVLAVVADGETYGYVIAQKLLAAGLGTVKGGTLYPILTRLEQDGLVTSRWQAGDAGPGRKYFAVTAAGRRALREQTDDWVTFTGRATALIATGRVS
ncbi:PadR family transcriptional regulator [Virgisporangium ochraceum]|uniref:Transcriptional regulator n=1 Tax=Virgisporangium ochraceum TaxID=65505 RepID=A0A8J4A506_9ACTN|nr:PadR family transcriptional regulator [Virgisporangium ochraceum]GIJ73490.1 transcriptional regulator [Virgisporangium ochraceum]